MREADRDEELAVVGVAQLERLVLAVGGRVAAEVDRDVVDGPARGAHELRLTGLELEVEGADSAPLRAGVVVLHELGVDAELAIVAAAIGLEEEPTRVGEDCGLDQHESLEARLEALESQVSSEAPARTGARSTRGTRPSGSAPTTRSCPGTTRP